MSNDWRYSDERMELRQEVFSLLREKYFNLKNAKNLYEFCHDWVSQGNTSTEGAEEAFLKYVDSLT
tara:strand:- start:50 stop:247 length:198 start_codon:yes stop_codon:yes gene_type:complete